MKLPIILKIKEDELLYSYLLRLSSANGFDDLRAFLAATEILPSYSNTQNAHRFIRYDIHSDLYPLLGTMMLPITESIITLYRQTSLFSLASIMSCRAISSHRIGMLSRYRNHTGLITPLEDVFQSLKFCPACRELDIAENGEWYYRRAHQIPGVTVCHRHGCALHLYHGKHGLELDADQPSNALDAHEKSMEYARFAHDLLNTDLQTDVHGLARAILSRMKELGYTKQMSARLQEDMGAYAELLHTPLKTFFRYFPPKNQCDMQTCISVMLFLFGDAKTLLASLPQVKGQPTVFRTLIHGKYELLSLWREDIIELHCLTCGLPFLSSPYRIESGWGCPTCDAGVSERTLFQRLFGAASCGDYDLLSFSGMKNPITIHHRACERVYTIRPRAFLEEFTRCPCGKVSSQAEMERRIKSFGNYALISYESAERPIKLLHKDCNRILSLRYARFIRHPNCKICTGLARSEQDFRHEIYDLVGDEYELVGPYRGRKQDVLIRHNTCNSMQNYKPQKFLSGTRCAKCHQRLTYAEFCRVVEEVSYGKYAVDQQIGKENAMIRNAETGEGKKLPIKRVMQELFRFKPSNILPLENRNPNIVLPTMVSKQVLDFLTERYSLEKPFSVKQLNIPGMTHQQLSRTIQNLYRANKIHKIAYGVYMIPQKETGG